MTQAQDAAWERIKEARLARLLSGGYKVGARWFHSDLISRIQQIGLLLLGQNVPSGLMWKTMDGDFVLMTPTLAQQIFQAALLSDSALHQTAESKRTAMLQADDPAQYDASLGWPKAYGE